MALRPKTICRKGGCGRLIDAPGYCDRHTQLAVGWNRSHADKSSAERGYGYAWQQVRKRILSRDKGLPEISFIAIPDVRNVLENKNVIWLSQTDEQNYYGNSITGEVFSNYLVPPTSQLPGQFDEGYPRWFREVAFVNGNDFRSRSDLYIRVRNRILFWGPATMRIRWIPRNWPS